MLGGIRTRNLQALDLAPLPVGLQAHGAATRCRSGSPPYEGGAAAVRGGNATGAGDRTSVAKVQSLDGMPTTHPVPVGEAESNPNRSRFELAALPDWTYSPVRRQGIEPRTIGLRVRYSAIELAARGADDRNRTGIHCLEGSNTSHCVTSARRLPRVATLLLPLFRRPLIHLS